MLVVVEMLTVGRELLIGRTLNTNAHWVGGRLARMGTMLRRITTVDDVVGEIASATREALGRSPDFLVVVGGLGPTPDDMTLKGIAECLGVALRPSRPALKLIQAHYRRRGLDVDLTPERRKMALFPIGAEPILNTVGTAPGVLLRKALTNVYSLPGVPAEMRRMFTDSAEPEIRRRLGKLHWKYVRVSIEGILESAFAPIIEAAMRRHPSAYIKSHPRGIRNGISRLELDVAVVGSNVAKTDEEAIATFNELKEGLERAGARIAKKRVPDTKNGMS